MKPIKTLSREELYKLVWTTPMTTLAKEFGLSDNGLRKKCKKHNIPLPSSGYWTKVAHNKKVRQTLLPPNSDPSLETIEIYIDETGAESTQSHDKSTLSEDQLEKLSAFTFPDRVNRYHHLLQEARKIAKATKYKNQYGHLDYGTKAMGLDVRITANTLDRASRFLQGLISLFSSLGWEFQQLDNRRNLEKYTAFVFNGEELEFKIKELVKQQLHVKTEKEKKDRYYWGSKYDYIPTGVLELSITNLYRTDFKITWKDKSSLPIENQVLEIAQGFSRAFALSKLRSIEAEKERKLWEIREAKRAEQQRLAEIEKQRRKDLLELVDSHRTCTDIRYLIAAFKDQTLSTDLQEWLDWAETVADSLDPLLKPDGILERFKQVEEEPSWRWQHL